MEPLNVFLSHSLLIVTVLCL